MLTSAEIRRSFLDYFTRQGHTVVPSAPLVPGGDETLLFTNSGMVQFKDVFLGTGSRPYTRAADSQKCMRVAGKHNDLDDVGRDDSHHTFFEMLGNWSFGDYTKREAIPWAWELLTEEWGLPKDRIWTTCFEDEQNEIPKDEEAAEVWARQPGFDSSQILFFGREENFWEMAETGPVGPDSEIHLDLGREFCNSQHIEGHECRVNGTCGRYLELWNLVFIEYNRTGAAQIEPLPQKHVDTGMGFERIVSVLQGTNSNYRTDLFTPLIETTRALAGHEQTDVDAVWTPYRVIADHSRAAAFLIADGVVPGNEGRNYVTRMIVRRASLFGAKLGFDEPFLAEVAGTVIEEYGEAYPELEKNGDAIRRLITDEEQRFARTVESGVARLAERLEEVRHNQLDELPGSWAFELYATYGLPLEITRDLARDDDVEVDEAGFFASMERHREVSSGEAAQAAGSDDRYRELRKRLQDDGALPPEGVTYDPYGALEIETDVIHVDRDGDSIAMVLATTPFYVEAGGQVSDSGEIRGPEWAVRVDDTRRPVQGLVVHYGQITEGEPAAGDKAAAAVDAERRLAIMRNHTATHLLHQALHEVLGHHARQAGSLVAPDRLRFDFTHSEPVTGNELIEIEDLVNKNIMANYPLRIEFEPREQAIAAGAMALFGETYGETVRTVCIGSTDCFSYELCGGTHLPATGGIGPFELVSEGSAAAGIRRIEAVTGQRALESFRQRRDELERISHTLGAKAGESHARLLKTLEEVDELRHSLNAMKASAAHDRLAGLTPQQIDGVPVLTAIIPEVDATGLRELADRFRSEHPSGVAVLASSVEARPVIIAAVSQDLVERGLHAGELVKSVAEVVGGGGGGKPTMAQAGGTDAARLPEALERVSAWVESHLN